MWDIVLNTFGKVLGSKDKDGESQFLELFKGQHQKQREFEIEMEKQFQTTYGMQLKDVAGAREMQIAALQQEDKFAKRFLYYMTAAILLCAFIFRLVPIFMDIPLENRDLVTGAQNFWEMIAGGSIMTFFYGTNTNKRK